MQGTFRFSFGPWNSKRPERYMSATLRTKVDLKLKNYFEMGFQNGGSRELIDWPG